MYLLSVPSASLQPVVKIDVDAAGLGRVSPQATPEPVQGMDGKTYTRPGQIAGRVSWGLNRPASWPPFMAAGFSLLAAQGMSTRPLQAGSIALRPWSQHCAGIGGACSPCGLPPTVARATPNARVSACALAGNGCRCAH